MFKSLVGCLKSKVGLLTSDFELKTFDLNNGFDLSLSFSLIAQSKAPLEKNYAAKVIMISEFFAVVYFWRPGGTRRFGCNKFETDNGYLMKKPAVIWMNG